MVFVRDFIHDKKILHPTTFLTASKSIISPPKNVFIVSTVNCRYEQIAVDTANLLARIVAFFHARIRVPHTLRINNQEGGFFMAPLLAALRNYLIF